MAHTPRWKKWLGMRNTAITTNPVRFLRGQVGDSDNIDLNLNNITQVGKSSVKSASYEEYFFQVVPGPSLCPSPAPTPSPAGSNKLLLCENGKS